MGLQDSSELSVIADGAPWIWEQAHRRLSPPASWCVDVYHVSEGLHQCARAMLGEGQAAVLWAQTQLQELIKAGGPKYLVRLDQVIVGVSDVKHVEALNALRVYLDGNRDRMWYAQR